MSSPYPPSSDHQSSSKVLCPKNSKPNLIRIFFYPWSKLFIILVFQALVLHFIFASPSKSVSILSLPQQIIQPLNSSKENCPNGFVYVYDLPAMFNRELLDGCHDLDPWHSRCNAVSNDGLGPKVSSLSGVPEELVPAWYWTDMLAGEVVYHSRILKHRCRTREAESATALYIPFYAGLAVGKYLFSNYTARERDMHCERLLAWLQDLPSWRRSNGSDHFIMLGRVSWDFRRSKNEEWGSSFLNMPHMKRVLRLTIERDPWDHTDVGVPYPTGFHPRSMDDVDRWLSFVRSRERTSLFTFAGAKRDMNGDFRAVLFNQCLNEPGSCRLVDCSGRRCYDGTSEILEAFLGSDFCLQPRGDTYTRRSIFDCMVAGSIPVFFWKRSVEKQYDWFLGNDPRRFSVFIDQREVRNGTSIRKVLEGYSKEGVRKMRAEVIRVIPKFIYRHADGSERVKDALDIAIDGVLRRLSTGRSRMGK